MKKILLFLVIFVSFNIFSAGAGCGTLLSEDGMQEGVCLHAEIDPKDKPSLQRGAQLYMNYCFACHSLKYGRYKRVADDLEIPYDIFEENLMFGDAKIGDLMEIGMQDKDSKAWFGAPPPDLTLEVSLHGADWVYSYLRSFYTDETRPLGVNNKVYENVGMPNVLLPLQGEQVNVCKPVPMFADNGGLKQDPLTGKVLTEEKCGFLELVPDTGTLTPEEFDQSILDLTNFLAYMSDPIKEKREYIGKYVILYLLILLVLTYLLYREFKKDLH
ncbi:MAG: cytochrome c1 [Gammaproteobacteria bacterium]|nr:MAG: cytochrome c1 [Gammaproteobacteria bacterium]